MSLVYVSWCALLIFLFLFQFTWAAPNLLQNKRQSRARTTYAVYNSMWRHAATVSDAILNVAKTVDVVYRLWAVMVLVFCRSLYKKNTYNKHDRSVLSRRKIKYEIYDILWINTICACVVGFYKILNRKQTHSLIIM